MRNYRIETEVTFEWRGVTCKAMFRADDARDGYTSQAWHSYADYQKDRDKKARIYYTGGREVMETVVGQHPPFSVKGDDPENDKAWRAYNRAESDLARTAIAAAYPEFGKSNFSRYAGCSCACSPGFISRELRGVHGFLTVTLEEGKNDVAA